MLLTKENTYKNRLQKNTNECKSNRQGTYLDLMEGLGFFLFLSLTVLPPPKNEAKSSLGSGN